MQSFLIMMQTIPIELRIVVLIWGLLKVRTRAMYFVQKRKKMAEPYLLIMFLKTE